MTTMADVRAARAQAKLTASRTAEAKRRECERRGHDFKTKRVWCLRCRSTRNPEYPRKPPAKNPRGPKMKPRPWR